MTDNQKRILDKWWDSGLLKSVHQETYDGIVTMIDEILACDEPPSVKCPECGSKRVYKSSGTLCCLQCNWIDF